MKKEKMLVFHSALAPYRIDQFNSLGEIFDLEIVFYLKNLASFKYDQKFLKDQCNFKISYLLFGLGKKNRFIRFGIYNKILKSKPDYILSYEYSPTTHYLLMLKRLGLLRQSIGTMVDDSIEMCINPQTNVRRISRNSIVKKLDFMVLLSNEVAQFYHSEFKINMNKLIVSPLIQLEERLKRNEKALDNIASEYITRYELKNKKVLLYIGRFIAVKGLANFLINITDLIINNDNLKIVLVGEGYERKDIEDLIKRFNIEDKVILPGRFENIYLYPWYIVASGFFLPSTFEPFGAVVNESLIFGTKVLCSQLAGASTLITADNGVIFNPLDKEDTINKTKEFLSKIEPVTDISLATSPSIMASHPNDYISEWLKVSLS